MEGIERSGLCATCVHLDVKRSQRGSIFFYCKRSETDPRFVRYPPIPVVACAGHEPKDGARRPLPSTDP